MNSKKRRSRARKTINACNIHIHIENSAIAERVFFPHFETDHHTLIHFIVKFTLFKGPIAVADSYFCIFLAISLG